MPFSKIEIAASTFVSFFEMSLALRWMYMLTYAALSRSNGKIKEDGIDLQIATWVGLFFLFVDALLTSLPIFLLTMLGTTLSPKSFSEKNHLMIACVAAFIYSTLSLVLKGKTEAIHLPRSLAFSSAVFIFVWTAVWIFNVGWMN